MAIDPMLSFSAADLLAERAGDAALTMAEDIPPRAIDNALARAGWGPDHLRGEALLGWVSDGGGHGAIIGTHRATILTRRAIHAVPYAAVTAVSAKPGMGLSEATVALGTAQVCWSGPESARLVPGLLSDLLRLQPHQRAPQGALRLPPAPTTDARQAALLALAADAPALSQVALLERLQYGGRGQSGGEWLSCLRPDDLAAVLCALFGHQPIREYRPQGHITLRWSAGSFAGDLAIQLASGLASQAIAAGMAAAVGVGIGAAPGAAPSIKSVSATIRPLAAGSGLVLRADRGTGEAPLSAQDAGRMAAVMHRLRQSEPRWLLRQLVGCTETSAEVVRAAAQARLPDADLSPFFTDRVRPAASTVPNPAYRPPARPAPVLPVRGEGPRVGEVAEWDQIIAGSGLILLGAAAINLVYPIGLFIGIAALGQAAEARAGLPGQPFAVAALVPFLLYPLAVLEASAGIAALWKRSAARPLIRAVCALEVLSACIGGLPSLVAAGLVAALDRQAAHKQRAAGR